MGCWTKWKGDEWMDECAVECAARVLMQMCVQWDVVLYKVGRGWVCSL